VGWCYQTLLMRVRCWGLDTKPRTRTQLWPIADVETRLSIRRLSEVKRSWLG